MTMDFVIATNKHARVLFDDFKNVLDYRTNAHKRRLETFKGKSHIAIDMVKRAIASGIYADYLLIDSWYSKPSFIKAMNGLGLRVIFRISSNNKIWNFTGEKTTLNAIYDKYKKLKNIKYGEYGKKAK
jgi:SRSO17 transposase